MARGTLEPSFCKLAGGEAIPPYLDQKFSICVLCSHLENHPELPLALCSRHSYYVHPTRDVNEVRILHELLRKILRSTSRRNQSPANRAIVISPSGCKLSDHARCADAALEFFPNEFRI
jgi:hypothetical protein